jgi:hypothetical protein
VALQPAEVGVGEAAGEENVQLAGSHASERSDPAQLPVIRLRGLKAHDVARGARHLCV